MALNDSFPGPSGKVDSSELRKDLAGILVKSTDGSPRAGVFYRGSAPIGTPRTGDMKVDIGLVNAALVRGGGPLFTQNDGVIQSPALPIPSSNSIYHVIYLKQVETAAPYSDAGVDGPLLGIASSDQGATPDVNQAISRIPTGGLALVSALVPSSAVTTSSGGVVLKDIAPFTATAGGVVVFRLLADLKAWSTAVDGQLAYALDTGNLWEYIASATTPDWYHVGGKPQFAAFSPTGLYTAGTPTPQAAMSAGRVFLEGKVGSSSASFTAGTTYTIGSIPAAFAPPADVGIPLTSNLTAVALLTVTSGGTVTIVLNTSFTGALNLSLAGASWRVKGLV
ncbi:hypothetical protein [Leifsonia virtsii]|uniref:Uncharacterized protein n=1 Tax=Leifsonia virtsii TaxID=3035915 RepID=A0ABT8J076_9MICO|nr:hypothetical protein [Leifsonia virtsii]MDN4598450.1 hypothetical protein [Leifsonia virtsii]